MAWYRQETTIIMPNTDTDLRFHIASLSRNKLMIYWYMMTSSNGNIFRVTGHLCGEFTGHWWIPCTKASDVELWFFIRVWINGWVNNCEASDLRRSRAHYDVTVINAMKWTPHPSSRRPHILWVTWISSSSSCYRQSNNEFMYECA